MRRVPVLLTLTSLAFIRCHETANEAPLPNGGERLAAARATRAPAIDGRLSEPIWLSTARTGSFTDVLTGRRSAPYAEARAVWDDAALYVAVYVADADLERQDCAGIRLAADGHPILEVAIDPAGDLRVVPASAKAGIAGAVDTDGTLGEPTDDDEEWTVEIEVPWSHLGLDGPGEVAFEAFRRDASAQTAPLEMHRSGRVTLDAAPGRRSHAPFARPDVLGGLHPRRLRR